MPVDIVVALFLLFMAWRGWVSGAFMQLIKIIAMVSGYLLGYFLSGALAPFMSKALSAGFTSAKSLSFILIWVCASLLVGFFLRRIARPMVEDGAPRSNKFFGLLLSLLKASAICYIILALISVAHPALKKTPLHKHLGLDSSYALKLVSGRNLMTKWSMPFLDRFENLVKTASQSPLKLSSESSQLIKEPAIGDLVKAPDIAQAVMRGDWAYVISDERFQKLLKDPQALRKLMESSQKAQKSIMSDME
jgi:uncharacterized membrane protein required for colicin V production